jgi:hypothetical protein
MKTREDFWEVDKQMSKKIRDEIEKEALIENNNRILNFMDFLYDPVTGTMSTRSGIKTNIKEYILCTCSELESPCSYCKGKIDMKFNSSWDWLMPIIEEIFNLDKDLWEARENIKDALMTFNIEETYSEVIEFIKRYNKNKDEN